MQDDPERRFEPVERRLYRDVYEALPPDVARTCGIDWSPEADVLRLTCSAADHPYFNRVMGVVGPETSLAEWVASVAGHYRDAGVSRWMIQVPPGRRTESLGEVMAAEGLAPLRGWAKHAASVGELEVPAVRSKLRVEAIGPDRSAAWASILAPAFGYPDGAGAWLEATVGRPGWTHYLALDGDVPAATAALFATNGVGTLTFAATHSDFRRRGAQSALIAARIRDARRMRLDWLVTETDEELPEKPNPSYHNVVRAGLPVRYVRANWGPPPPEPTGSPGT